MKIGVVQMGCTPGDVHANCAKISRFAKRAKEKGCEAVIFPELVDTGYDMSMIQETASSWDTDRSEAPFTVAADAARGSELFLVCGLTERSGEKIYNSTAVFDPRGTLVGKYRKTHLAAYSLFNEDDFIVPGDSLETVKVSDMTWGLIICYDVRFPELSRTLVLGGAEVIALSSAWPFPRLTQWKTLIRCRAIENQAYVIAANRVGTDASITFCGSSGIIDPYGVIVAEAAEDREELIVGEISRGTLQSVRDYIPVLTQRREDLYRIRGEGP